MRKAGEGGEGSICDAANGKDRDVLLRYRPAGT